MAFSKITLNGTTLMDVTQDTVDEENLLAGETATKANGVRTTGTLGQPIELGIPYDGVDLTAKFATEISGFSDVWAWLHDRIGDGNYDGIHIGDYIPFTCTNTAATQLNAKILGINTYKSYGNSISTAIGNHIDFWAGVWPSRKAINTVYYNNGTSQSAHPWVASDLYLFCNSLQGSVASAATANPTLTAKDYRSDGIYYYFPTALKNVIVEKEALLEKRYNSLELLADANERGWVNIGKVWVPHEVEIYGTPIFSKPGYASAGFVHYPFFACNMNRLAFGRTYLWLLSPTSGSTQTWCGVDYNGAATTYFTSNTGVSTPVCFRVA